MTVETVAVKRLRRIEKRVRDDRRVSIKSAPS